ncbi:5-oxoprolinase subunit C family protein [Alkalimonas mucilaginosa]|uniref:Biotin-dependent carboxyltransferase family protein n=1 Tax=Alkalimonas mucilaginosa TaxID=3057676 RepID=A0ABU7JBL1_9GAMM|nr:biotin-dependent carboxyltransferase family protein [Alkalimonas sp. MEB004]MEE2022987.1 biotin-dependent carboxyltransferase family protein [Alkalimonas sp. MEB004]
MSGFRIEQPGLLCTLQDQGRFGQSRLGLTTAGPADGHAFRWANALLGNTPGSCALEITLGGLQLSAEQDTAIAVCGAAVPFSINGKPKALWQGHIIKAGDRIELGMATAGVRAYLAVAGGFRVAEQFGSCATVLREGIGGLDGGKLQAGQLLPLTKPAAAMASQQLFALPERFWPDYQSPLTLRLIEGYQCEDFSVAERQRFYQHPYQISPKSDRMGCRLQGPPLHCQRSKMLSEGICYGAVQVPPDGQPIVLLSDRQTLGGYPKLGSVLSLDCWQLAQRSAGFELQFAAISMEQAHNLLHLQEQRFWGQHSQLEVL